MSPNEQEAVLRRWIEEHQGVLFRVVRSHEADPDNQQDLFQEMIVQLWRSVPAFGGRCKESTWIYRVALNTAYSWRRSEKRRRERHQLFAAFVAATDTGPAQAASARSDLEFLYRAIRQLPRHAASLVVMHLDGLSTRDIAEVLGISENNVAVRLTRARKQLTDLMKEEGR